MTNEMGKDVEGCGCGSRDCGSHTKPQSE